MKKHGFRTDREAFIDAMVSLCSMTVRPPGPPVQLANGNQVSSGFNAEWARDLITRLQEIDAIKFVNELRDPILKRAPAEIVAAVRAEFKEVVTDNKRRFRSSTEGGGLRNRVWLEKASEQFVQLKCPACHRSFVGRPNAKTCSPKCRTALYRKRRA
jgi:hypothetical protein